MLSCVRPEGAALIMAAGWYGDARNIGTSSSRASWPFESPCFVCSRPCRSIALTVRRPPHTHVSDAACTQADALAGFLKSLFVVIMDQRPRATLLARAMATSMRGFLASIRPSQLPSGAPLRLACCTTAIAPVMSSRRVSRWPIFDVPPSRCLPPVECCRGTRPSHAAKSRDRRKMVMGGAKVSIAIALIGPTPGIPTSTAKRLSYCFL